MIGWERAMREQMMAGVEHLQKRVSKLGADIWEVYGEYTTVRAKSSRKRRSRELEMGAGMVEEWNEMGWAVRLKKAGRLVFSAANTEEQVLRSLERGIVSVASFPETEWEAPAIFDPDHQPIQPDPRWQKEPVETRLKVLTELEVLPELAYLERRRERALVNSRGISVTDESTYFEVWSGAGPVALQRTFGALLEDLLRNYHRILRARRPEPWEAHLSSKEIPWLLPPDEAVTLLAALVYAAELGNGLPERVSPEIDLLDDGVLPGGYGTEAFDGQGAKTRKVMIYENGKPPEPRGLVQDNNGDSDVPPASQNSGRPRARWAHWRRDSYIHRPRLGFTNLVMPPGELEMGFFVGEFPEVFAVHELRVTLPERADRVSLSALGTVMRNGRPVETAIMRVERLAGEGIWRRISARCREFTMVGRLGMPALVMEATKRDECG